MFLQNGNGCLSPRLIHVAEIWFADRFWSSDESDIAKRETGSSNASPRLPSCKSIRRYNSAVGGPVGNEMWCVNAEGRHDYGARSKSKPKKITD